jgi:hypothetical protein
VAISRSAKHSAVRFGACAHDRSRRLECQADREIAVSGTCLGSEQSNATDRSSVPKSWPELRIRKTAAQTRIVSGGGFWPIRRELSRHFKYMARGRIPEFESYHPSHAVVSSAVMTGEAAFSVSKCWLTSSHPARCWKRPLLARTCGRTRETTLHLAPPSARLGP